MLKALHGYILFEIHVNIVKFFKSLRHIQIELKVHGDLVVLPSLLRGFAFLLTSDACKGEWVFRSDVMWQLGQTPQSSSLVSKSSESMSCLRKSWLSTAKLEDLLQAFEFYNSRYDAKRKRLLNNMTELLILPSITNLYLHVSPKSQLHEWNYGAMWFYHSFRGSSFCDAPTALRLPVFRGQLIKRQS